MENKDKAAVAKVLKKLGMRVNRAGYEYLVEIISKHKLEEVVRGNLIKKVYAETAETFNTMPLRVERCIRTAIEDTWTNGNYEFQNELFSYSVSSAKGKPTNGQFIATLIEYFEYL